MKKCMHENVPLKNLYKVFLSLKDEPIWLGCEVFVNERLLKNCYQLFSLMLIIVVDGLIFFFKILMLCMFIYKFI